MLPDIVWLFVLDGHHIHRLFRAIEFVPLFVFASSYHCHTELLLVSVPPSMTPPSFAFIDDEGRHLINQRIRYYLSIAPLHDHMHDQSSSTTASMTTLTPTQSVMMASQAALASLPTPITTGSSSSGIINDIPVTINGSNIIVGSRSMVRGVVARPTGQQRRPPSNDNTTEIHSATITSVSSSSSVSITETKQMVRMTVARGERGRHKKSSNDSTINNDNTNPTHSSSSLPNSSTPTTVHPPPLIASLPKEDPDDDRTAHCIIDGFLYLG
jgi:hypothetical protein